MLNIVPCVGPLYFMYSAFWLHDAEIVANAIIPQKIFCLNILIFSLLCFTFKSFDFVCKTTKKINAIHIKMVTLHLKIKEQYMGIISFLSKMFGTKSERDLKALTPILNEVLALEDEFLALSNDELRARTQELRKGIHEHISGEEKQIAELREKAQGLDIWEREEVFNEIDKIEEKIDKKIEEHLMTILPQAFSILKETARRFKDNAEVVVTATDFDRDLAASNDFVTIDRDMAIWKNSWVAGGNMGYGSLQCAANRWYRSPSGKDCRNGNW